MRLLALLAFLSGLAHSLRPSSPPLANTTLGLVQGLHSGGAQVWLGVPFAQPPVGHLRWRPPLHPIAWGPQTLMASEQKPACMQAAVPLFPPPKEMSEDCLYANVYAPEGQYPPGGWPVMVWIHGGAWMYGGTAEYDPRRLAIKGQVLVVSISYRLGVFGWLVLPEFIRDGGEGVNFGLRDQQMALRWVRENAAAFGGDPNRVTIFGESAGGGSVMMHLLMESSRGLFQRVISESPGTWMLDTSAKLATNGATFAFGLGCANATDVDLACLKALTAQRIMGAIIPFTLLPAPSVDGVLLPQQPAALFRAGRFTRDVQMLAGSNEEEGNFFAYFSFGQSLAPVPDFVYELTVNTAFGMCSPSVPALVLPVYNPSRQRVGNWHTFGMANADYGINCGFHLSMQAIAHFADSFPLFRYKFSHGPRNWTLSFLNATHGVEMPYVMGQPVMPGLSDGFDEEEWELSDAVIRWWSTFAYRGDPNVDGLTRWPRYIPDPVRRIGQGLELKLPVSGIVATQMTMPVCDLWAPILTSNTCG